MLAARSARARGEGGRSRCRGVPSPQPPSNEGSPIPIEVVRQPLPELEVALTRGPVPPRRRNFVDAAPIERSFDGQLQRELETRGAVDRHRVEEAARVELEVVRRVMGRNAGEPVERQACSPAHEPLDQRATDLVTAAHVPRGGDDVSASPGLTDHVVDDVGLIRAVGHRDEDEVTASGTNASFHRVQDTATEVVPETAHGWQLSTQPLDDGDGRILVEVVYD